MSTIARGVACAVVALGLWTASAPAQQPEGRYVTVSTFNLPIGPGGDTVMMYIDSVMVPMSRINPNIASFRVGRHAWGTQGGHVALIYEYTSWAAINAECGQPCQQWETANRPAPGTPRADLWRAMNQAFLRQYSGHLDQIYFVPARRMN